MNAVLVVATLLLDASEFNARWQSSSMDFVMQDVEAKSAERFVVVVVQVFLCILICIAHIT